MSFTGIPITSAQVIKSIFVQQFPSSATGTTTIPLDNTIPTNTEGTEFVSAAVTPNKTNNRMFVDAMILCSSNTADRTIIVAMFSGSSCRAVNAVYVASANKLVTIPIWFTETVEGTSEVTYSLRAGLDAAGTIQVNNNGAQVFNGQAGSYLRVLELQGV